MSNDLFYGGRITNLKDHLAALDRAKCKGCPHLRNEDLIVIPPPKGPENKARMIFITKAPTIEFVPFYMYSQQFSGQSTRNILFSAGPPHDLIKAVSKYLWKKGDLSPEISADLFSIFGSAYWTHMRMCPMEDVNKYAWECADRMLIGQIQAAYNDGIRTVIVLGREPYRWVKVNFSGPDLDLVYLPDPTGKSTVWDDTKHPNRKELEENIGKLLEICHRCDRTRPT